MYFFKFCLLFSKKNASMIICYWYQKTLGIILSLHVHGFALKVKILN